MYIQNTVTVSFQLCFDKCNSKTIKELEQLECLRSEDTPHHLMITHSIELYWIPSQKKNKVKVTNLKNLPKLQIF